MREMQLPLIGRGVGNFTFVDINVNSKELEFRIPKSLFDKKDLPHVVYENGEHLPHPQFAAEILGSINS